MPGRYHKNEPHPYPYTIPDPPVLNPESQRALNNRLEYVREFLRIEALLRSPRVWTLFNERRDDKPDELQKRYGVEDGWQVLMGAHHRYLDPHAPVGDPKLHNVWLGERMVLDLRVFLEREPEAGDLALRSLLRDRHYLLWVIDPSYQPEALIDVMRPRLKHAHKSAALRIPLPRYVRYTAEDGVEQDRWLVPQRYIRPTREADVVTWLTYLHCYDLRWRDALSFGKVARGLQPDLPCGKSATAVEARKKAASRVRKGVRAVRDLIAKVEQEQPPSPMLLISDSFMHRRTRVVPAP